jgi:hypothetical protein
MPRLTDQEQQEIIRYIEADKSLPDKYRFLLFEDKREVELIWNGKSSEVCNIVLPFQVIEQVDEPRAEKPEDTAPQLGLFDTRGRQMKGWTNKLIWGDNKLILSSLKNGPLREEIEQQGGLKLIYIDPPFDVGADFSMDIAIGSDTFTKKPNILEEIAYRDTWGKGADSFIAMIYERLILMRDLLAEDGSIYVHCDWRVTSFIRCVLDEVFGQALFRNEIIWKRTTSHSDANSFGSVHDSIWYFAKDKAKRNTILQDYDEEYIEAYYRYEDADGRKFMSGDLSGAGAGPPRHFGDQGEIAPPPGRHWMFDQKGIDKALRENRVFWTRNGVPRLKRFLDEAEGMPASDLWADIQPLRSWHRQEATSNSRSYLATSSFCDVNGTV